MGAVVGHVFALEGFAFFIEAIFLGLYLYGWGRLTPAMHWFCGIIIALSGMVSGVLVLGVNAWMQVPVGFELDEAGRILVTDPVAIFRNYGWVTMALHSTLSCYMAVAFAVAAVYAFAWLGGRRDAYHRSAIVIALAIGAVAAVAQPISGDLLAKFVYRTQPAKFAAMEGQFQTQWRAPVRLGGVPDEEARTTRYAIEVPGLLSFLAAHDINETVTGLNDIPRELWPNIHVTHYAFQLMVGIGIALLALSLWFWIAHWRGDALMGKSLLWSVVVAGPLGFIALEAGWFVTEVGRQPWIIQNVMFTRDAVTPNPAVPTLLAVFTVLYLVLGAVVVALLRSLAAGHLDKPRNPAGEIHPKP
jgi:cytochrome d ubiquinol oxidase subunit I